jgi:pantoate--beta-alanine ligase
MILFKKSSDLRKWIDTQRITSKTLGFIPTMGALHDGHISLIETAKKQNPVTVCSIFVNPAQFNDPKDFEKYPVTIEKDILMLEQAGCNVLFLPSVIEIYPEGISKKNHYDLGFIETVLEGKYRPGHFQGVCMVMQRLLEIVLPDQLYLGQKDYQQCMVIKKLIEIIGLSIRTPWEKNKIEVVICPTLREPNGLAMSSRNMRLNEEEKEKAAAIYKSLLMIKENFTREAPATLKQKAQTMLLHSGLKPDYVEITDAENLSNLSIQKQNIKSVALIAAFMNDVRLIDNMIIN